MGRRKVEMKRIIDSSSRLITFSKRRSGLFKKANEIATLCGGDIAIIIFSPGGKAFSFGQPTVEKVINQFQKKNEKRFFKHQTSWKARSANTKVNKLTQKLANLEAQLAHESAPRAIEIGGKKLNKKEIEELNLDELIELTKQIQDLCTNANIHLKEIEASNTLLLLANGTS